MPPKAAPALPAPLKAAIDEFVENQREVDELEPRLEALQKKNEELRFKLHEYMTDAGLSSIKTDSLGTFMRSIKGPYAQTIDRDAAEAWAKEHGLFNELFKFMPVSARISSLVSQTLKGENDVDLSSLKKGEIFDWAIRKTISWRRPDSLAKPEKERG